MGEISSILLLPLLFFVIVQSEFVRVPLRLHHDQDNLVSIVNMLQKSQAQLLKKDHYEHIEHNKETGTINTLLVQLEAIKKTKSHNHPLHTLSQQSQKHNKKQSKSHIAVSHKIQHDDERLMDFLPQTKKENKNSHTLQPANEDVEKALNGDSKQFMQGFLKGKDNFSNENKKEKLQTFIKIKANVPLENVGNTMFIGELTIGSEKNHNAFNVIFDTGSALTCIASKLCSDIGCTRSNQYDRHKSQTFEEIGKKVEITFGSGTLRGLVNKERMQVDGLNLDNALFIEITEQIGDAFHEGDFDGIVGLGYPHMTGVPTLFDYMIYQHKLDRNIFSFHLNRQVGHSGSQLIFGGLDNSLIEGEWVYHKVHQKFYWSILATELHVGDKNTNICSHGKPCKLVVDTGTTLLTGPPNDVRKLLSMIEVKPKCQNFYEIPSLTFVIDGHKYTLDVEDYVLSITNKGVEPPYQHSKVEDIVACAGTLFPLDIQEPQGPLWILGDIFISKYSSVFDRDTDKIGLGLSKWYVDQKKKSQKSK